MCSILLIAGCGGGDGTAPVQPQPQPQPQPPVPPSADVAAITLTLGGRDSLFSLRDTVRVTADARTVSGAAATGATIAWTSSDPGVVTVGASGTSVAIVAAGNGRATVTARSGTASAQVAVTVRQRVALVVPQPATLSIAAGAAAQLTAVPRDSRGNDVPGLAPPGFVSSDTTRVRVTATGAVSAVAAGSASISVSQTTPDGVVRATVPVTVNAPATGNFPLTATVSVQDFEFQSASVDIAAGGTVRWTWNGYSSHDVTSSGGGPLSSPTQTAGSYVATFPTPGRFEYFCSVHPFMVGAVIVH